jgi:hypothetical protein
MKAMNKDSCRPLFRLLNIPLLHSQYIFSILIFVVNNLDLFHLNSDIRNIYTIHLPTYKLTKVQKGVSYSGIRLFNNLPQDIENLLNDVNKFKHALKTFLLVGSFYYLDEHFEWRIRDDLGTYK